METDIYFMGVPCPYLGHKLIVPGATRAARLQTRDSPTPKRCKVSLAACVVERGEHILVLGLLSAEAQAARAPLPVEVLLSGALHDAIHKNPGRARAARTIRNLKAKVQDEQVTH